MPQRRSYGSGSLTIRNLTDGRRVYDGKWRDAHGRQIKRRVGLVRTPHQPDGLTKSQAEARLRDLIRDTAASPPLEHARTLQAAMDAWLTSLEAGGTKASSVRAYRSAMRKWFLPVLGTRSLDRIATSDIEHAMKQMRDAEPERQEHPELRRRHQQPVQLRDRQAPPLVLPESGRGR